MVKVEAEDAGNTALALFSAAAPPPSSRNLMFHISSSSSIKLVLEIFVFQQYLVIAIPRPYISLERLGLRVGQNDTETCTKCQDG